MHFHARDATGAGLAGTSQKELRKPKPQAHCVAELSESLAAEKAIPCLFGL
jgi:hypothetical protein